MSRSAPDHERSVTPLVAPARLVTERIATRPDVLTVALVTPHDIVGIGVRSMLEEAGVVFRMVDAGEEEADVLLYDVVALADGDTAELDRWVNQTASTVIAIDRPLRPDLAALALECGAVAVVPLASSAAQIADAVLAAAVRHRVDAEMAPSEPHRALGAVAGLSPREIEVLELIVQGRTNVEIAAELFLSVNSVKTYIRSAYRKMGVTTRARAVAWGVLHGFRPPSS